MAVHAIQTAKCGEVGWAAGGLFTCTHAQAQGRFCARAFRSKEERASGRIRSGQMRTAAGERPGTAGGRRTERGALRRGEKQKDKDAFRSLLQTQCFRVEMVVVVVVVAVRSLALEGSAYESRSRAAGICA